MKEPTDSNVPQIRFKGFAGEWEITSLATACDLLTGNPFESKKFSMSGVFLVRGMNVKRGYLDNSASISEYWPSSSGLESYSLEEDDIVIQMDGALIGRSYAKIRKDHLPALLVQRVTRVRCENKAVSDFSDFLYQYIQRDFLCYIQRSKTETAVPHLSLDDIRNFPIATSSSKEQTQIGGYFREVDRLIGLQQRKHDKLVTLKKAMLHAMFPQPGTTTPEIRFKGFSGDWVEKKLGEAMANVANNTLSRANLNYRSGLARNIHYGDILVRFGEVLNVQSNGVPFVSDDAVVKKLMSSRLENGDIVLADAAEDEMVGKCTEIQNVGDQIVLAGLHTIPLRPLIHFAPFYLGYYLNSNGYHDQLLPIMQGTKVLSISKTAIKQTTICFPAVEAEQQKIGHYFRTLDALISQHAIQLQKLKQLKSACLEKMFV